VAKSRFQVYLTADAEADLEEITDYIEAQQSSEQTDRVFTRIKSTIPGLESSPKRGRVVPELREIGVLEYREVVRKPHRIVYFTMGRQVYVVAILDGRRDLEDLLARRLLR